MDINYRSFSKLAEESKLEARAGIFNTMTRNLAFVEVGFMRYMIHLLSRTVVPAEDRPTLTRLFDELRMVEKLRYAAVDHEEALRLFEDIKPRFDAFLADLDAKGALPDP